MNQKPKQTKNGILAQNKKILLKKITIALKKQNIETLPNVDSIAKILEIRPYEFKKIFKSKSILKKELHLFKQKTLFKKNSRKSKMKFKNTIPLKKIIENEFVISYYLWNY